MTSAAPRDDLVCCPVCDALHTLDATPEGRRARCIRCNTVLSSGGPEAMMRVVLLASASLILMTIVIFFPFLQLRQGVFTAKASVFDTVMSFSQGVMAPLSLAVGLFIIVLPVGRLTLLIWALGPLSFGTSPWPGARFALRWAERIRPWAMAEIFMIGVAVALVKLADLATLTMGPAFWSFAAIVAITAFQDTQLSRHSIWTALDTARSTR
ncbi:paraquat-inducible protein A [Jannaschia sp. LMIT008]|uniref:paraquat-inducible protein A n=1 Tax=Jannaschia maritima TaxID=3032585 RepID=UPI002811D2E8|nr:paraquat-inducible protein A [Jannaschia sp. LMIT008]